MYEYLDEEVRAMVRKKEYVDAYLNRLNIGFQWLSDTIKIPRNLEMILHVKGLLAFHKKKKIFMLAQPMGERDDYNEYTEFTCFNLGNEKKEYGVYKNHKDIIILPNTENYTSDLPMIDRYSYFQSNIDVSMLHQLINSRNIPILVANNDNVKREVEKVFEKIELGKPVVVTTSLLSEIETLDILDHDAIGKMECLNGLHEVILKRACNLFGVDLEVKDKKAQVNNTELKSYDDFKTLGYEMYYISRQRFCEEMKENGFDIECIRNPIFSEEPTMEEIEEEIVEEPQEEQKEGVDDENKDD